MQIYLVFSYINKDSSPKNTAKASQKTASVAYKDTANLNPYAVQPTPDNAYIAAKKAQNVESLSTIAKSEAQRIVTTGDITTYTRAIERDPVARTLLNR